MKTAIRRISKRMKELRGKLRQKQKGGAYYYRLTVGGLRKEFALKTSDEDEAIQRATDLDAIYEAPTQEVALAQINAIKGFSKWGERMDFANAWEQYLKSPDRATPATVAEQNSYKFDYDEFVRFASPKVADVSGVNIAICESFAAHLGRSRIAVATHNRKIKHLRKIFDCLKEYYIGDNPFRNKRLFRKEREEQHSVVRRQAFSKEEEQQLRDVLADTVHRVLNKPEIRVIYYIGMFTGQRLKDCVLLQWQNVDMAHKRMSVKQFKTGKRVTIPIAPELYDVFVEARAWKCDQYVCPKSAARYSKTDRDGKNVGNNLVNIDVLRAIRWIGLEPSVSVPGRKKKMTVYGFHSLRHSFASFCAEAGVPKAVVESILGASSEIVDKYYTHVGDAAQRQAIDAVSMSNPSRSPQEKISEALAFLDRRSGDAPPDFLAELKRILS